MHDEGSGALQNNTTVGFLLKYNIELFKIFNNWIALNYLRFCLCIISNGYPEDLSVSEGSPLWEIFAKTFSINYLSGTLSLLKIVSKILQNERNVEMVEEKIFLLSKHNYRPSNACSVVLGFEQHLIFFRTNCTVTTLKK